MLPLYSMTNMGIEKYLEQQGIRMLGLMLEIDMFRKMRELGLNAWRRTIRTCYYVRLQYYWRWILASLHLFKHIYNHGLKISRFKRKY